MRQRIGSRRIQKIGGSLYINLPKLWADEHGLETGDVVDLFVEDDKGILLVIYRRYEKKKKSRII